MSELEKYLMDVDLVAEAELGEENLNIEELEEELALLEDVSEYYGDLD